MPPKKKSGDDGEGRDSSPAATSEKVSTGTPGGGISRQEMRDMIMEAAESYREMLRKMMEDLDGKMKVCKDKWHDLLKAHEDKRLAGLEAKRLSHSVLVPPIPGQTARHEPSRRSNFSRPSPTTPVLGRYPRTSEMLDEFQQATLRVVEKYGQQHGRPESGPGAAQDPKQD